MPILPDHMVLHIGLVAKMLQGTDQQFGLLQTVLNIIIGTCNEQGRTIVVAHVIQRRTFVNQDRAGIGTVFFQYIHMGRRLTTDKRITANFMLAVNAVCAKIMLVKAMEHRKVRTGGVAANEDLLGIAIFLNVCFYPRNCTSAVFNEIGKLCIWIMSIREYIRERASVGNIENTDFRICVNTIIQNQYFV